MTSDEHYAAAQQWLAEAEAAYRDRGGLVRAQAAAQIATVHAVMAARPAKRTTTKKA